MKSAVIIMAVFFVFFGSIHASDISIDQNGNVTTGSSNSDANLEVTGSSGEDGILGSASGTGAAGVYGENRTGNNTNYGILGYDSYGVYGYSDEGYAGYFEGRTRVTGDLILDGILVGFSEKDPFFTASPLFGVSSEQVTGWNSAYGWGDHSTAGYDPSVDAWSGTVDVYMLSGNVGIGTSTPGSRLSVVGDASISGNVGIGTATPQATLDINDNEGRGRIILRGMGDGYNTSELSLGKSSGAGEWNLAHRTFSDYPDGFIIEEFDGTSYETRIGIHSQNMNNGRIYLNPFSQGGVSIGSDFSAPASGYGWTRLGDLHVFSEGLSLIEFIGGGDDWNYNILTLEAYEPDEGYPHWSIIHRKNNDIGGASHGLGFEYWDGVSYDIKMAVDVFGNVGIGTSFPSHKLTVAGMIESTSGGIKLPDGSTIVSANALDADTVDGFHAVDFAPADHTHPVQSPGGGTYAEPGPVTADIMFSISASHQHQDDRRNPHHVTAIQVGAAEIDHGHDHTYVNRSGDTISGDLLVMGIVDLDSDLYIAGDLYLESDAGSKQDVLPIVSPLKKLKQIEGITFRWKDEMRNGRNDGNARHYGVVAQDLAEVFPGMVRRGKDGMKKVAYTELIPVLIEAVKEQHALMESQKKEIDMLRERVVAFERRLR